MTHNTKWIIGVLVIIGFIGLVFVLGIAGFVFYVTKGEGSGDYEARQIEGREFGKTTDQAGCMKEGLERSKKIRLLDVNHAIANQMFVEECLKSASPIPGFCDGVPPLWQLQDSEWSQKQCEKERMDELRTSCVTVFKAKLNLCHSLK